MLEDTDVYNVIIKVHNTAHSPTLCIYFSVIRRCKGIGGVIKSTTHFGTIRTDLHPCKYHTCRQWRHGVRREGGGQSFVFFLPFKVELLDSCISVFILYTSPLKDRFLIVNYGYGFLFSSPPTLTVLSPS